MFVRWNVLTSGTNSQVSKNIFVYDKAIIGEGLRLFNITLLSIAEKLYCKMLPKRAKIIRYFLFPRKGSHGHSYYIIKFAWSHYLKMFPLIVRN